MVTDPEVLPVHAPSLVRGQVVPLGPRSGRTILIVVAMVAALATGVIPAPAAGLLAAGAMILSGVVSMEAAYKFTDYWKLGLPCWCSTSWWRCCWCRWCGRSERRTPTGGWAGECLSGVPPW